MKDRKIKKGTKKREEKMRVVRENMELMETGAKSNGE